MHPMRATPSRRGWVPDFGCRLLAEDVPSGLVPIKGCAQILGVPTPWIDRVVGWAQEQLGREYLVGGRLEGADVAATDAPQAYGATTPDQLLIRLRGAGAAEPPPSPRHQASSCAAQLQAVRLHSAGSLPAALGTC